MTAYRVTAAGRSDLETITYLCDECETGIELHPEKARVPDNCPSCSKPLPEGAKAALAAIGRFHREAKALEEQTGKPAFRFEIKSEP
jgi:hypothetical protein